jgi:hypothetical protein
MFFFSNTGLFVVGVGDVLRIGGATGGSGNLFTNLSNVARLAAHPKFVWVFNANYDGTIIYNDPVYYILRDQINIKTCHVHISICVFFLNPFVLTEKNYVKFQFHCVTCFGLFLVFFDNLFSVSD